MTLKLIEPSTEFKNEYIEMIKEWSATGERLVPFVLRFNYHEFDSLIIQNNNLRDGIDLPENTVKSSSYWLVNESRELIGAVNIRHNLNENLLKVGGHIGYGIRPSKRRKGNATEILRQALLKAKELGISRALLTCDKDNIGSAKTIKKNGGILESEVMIEGTVVQRYWIEIN